MQVLKTDYLIENYEIPFQTIENYKLNFKIKNTGVEYDEEEIESLFQFDPYSFEDEELNSSILSYTLIDTISILNFDWLFLENPYVDLIENTERPFELKSLTYLPKFKVNSYLHENTLSTDFDLYDEIEANYSFLSKNQKLFYEKKSIDFILARFYSATRCKKFLVFYILSLSQFIKIPFSFFFCRESKFLNKSTKQKNNRLIFLRKTKKFKLVKSNYKLFLTYLKITDKIKAKKMNRLKGLNKRKKKAKRKAEKKIRKKAKFLKTLLKKLDNLSKPISKKFAKTLFRFKISFSKAKFLSLKNLKQKIFKFKKFVLNLKHKSFKQKIKHFLNLGKNLTFCYFHFYFQIDKFSNLSLKKKDLSFLRLLFLLKKVNKKLMLKNLFKKEEEIIFESIYYDQSNLKNINVDLLDFMNPLAKNIQKLKIRNFYIKFYKKKLMLNLLFFNSF